MKIKWNNSIGFTGFLQIAFIVLKLCDVIRWSWWWVLSPLWMPIAIAVIMVVIVTWANGRY